MQRIVSRINDLLSAVTGWLMMLMMSLLLIDVIWRTFARPLFGMAEMSVFVMMIVIYLGLSRCEEHDDHVRLEFLVDHARGGRRRAMVIASRVFALLAVMALFYAVTTDAWAAYLSNDSLEGRISLPIWPTKFVMVVGAAMFLLQTALNLFKPIRPSDRDHPSGHDEAFE